MACYVRHCTDNYCMLYIHCIQTNIIMVCYVHTLYTDNSLALNLTVDDHSNRLEKFEGVLARIEMLGKFYSTCIHHAYVHASLKYSNEKCTNT